MTRTPTLLGAEYDAPATLSASLDLYEPKRVLALSALRRFESSADDEEVLRLMYWELGLIDLRLAHAPGMSPYGGAEYEQYATPYRLAPETADYARQRANETEDVILKLHYLEFALLRMEPRGREWLELQREILRAYRKFVDGCVQGAGNDLDCHTGVHIEHALRRIGQLLSCRGLVRPEDGPPWAGWILRLAEDSRSFPVKDPAWTDRQRHRWVADYLRRLCDLPPDATAPAIRTQGLALLADAGAYYAATPLNDHFEHHVAEVEAELRKHWGEAGTHERMIRRRFEATIRRAEFHRGTGNGLLTAVFFRQARELVEEHRQYFTDADVARLQVAEQQALDRAVEGGEFKHLGVSLQIPKELMDYLRDTPEATVQAIVTEVARSVPDRDRIRGDVRDANAQAPLHAIIQRTVVGAGKVVGETTGEAGNIELEIELRAMLQTQLLAAGIAESVRRAASELGLSPEHLLAPLATLDLDEGTRIMIQRGCERLIAGDFISAAHILVPRVEDVLRQHLKALGVDTTEFRANVGHGTSRTDDAPLGSLMRKALPDGRTVRAYLGSDVWEHIDSVLNSQTGPNLRNEFAHWLARPQHCTAEVAVIALSLLWLLAEIARSAVGGAPEGAPQPSRGPRASPGGDGEALAAAPS